MFCFVLLCFAHCSLLSAFRLCTFGLWAFGLFGLFGHFPLRASCASILLFGLYWCYGLSLVFPIPNSQLFMFFSILPFSFPMGQIRSIQRLLCTFFFFPPEFTLCSIHFPFFFLLWSAFVRLSSVGGWELSSFTASPLLVPLFLLDFECLFPSRTGFSTQTSGSSSIASIAAGFVCV